MIRPQVLRRLGGRRRFLVCLLCACFSANAQIATSAADFGPADPVVVAGAWTLSPPPGVVFDFGARHLIFDGTAVVATNGAELVAHRVTVSAGAALLGAVRLTSTGTL